MLIIIILLFSIATIVPSGYFLNFQLYLKRKFAWKSMSKSAEELLLWLDGLGGASGGFDLNQKLPPLNAYKEYSVFVHRQWHLVKKNGGGLLTRLKPIKLMLRSEVKRQKKKSELMAQAWLQNILSLGSAWAFCFYLAHSIGISLKGGLLTFILLWPAIGMGGYLLLLRKYERRLFKDLDYLSAGQLSLLDAYLVGELRADSLNLDCPKGGRGLVLWKNMERVLASWREMGRGELKLLLDLEEDLLFFAECQSHRFLEGLKIINFLWSIVFILPVVFSPLIFGLEELLVV